MHDVHSSALNRGPCPSDMFSMALALSEILESLQLEFSGILKVTYKTQYKFQTFCQFGNLLDKGLTPETKTHFSCTQNLNKTFHIC